MFRIEKKRGLSLFFAFRLCQDNIFVHLQTRKLGRVAEWLGRGLQNLVQRFESALDLKKITIELIIIKKMGVTRLKRKDRKNKTVSRLKKQRLKMATDKSIKKPVARPEVAATEATSAE